jgi:hypothetical protein
VAIKASLGRGDFQVDPLALRMGLLQEGFRELPIQVEHVLAVSRPRPLRSGWACSPPIALWWAMAKGCAGWGEDREGSSVETALLMQRTQIYLSAARAP